VFLALFGLAVAVSLVRWPIVAVDTDLWYHLSAGRFIAEHHALPQEAFFSFLRPSPHWLDYYWLAQLLFYGIHGLFGYGGLVALRFALVAGTFGLILAILRVGQTGRAGLAWSAIAFSAVALFLLPRFVPIRPHDLSYLAIAAVAFLLESRRFLWKVPLLALLWVNLHGIEFPVLLLILSAYLGEWTLARLGWLPAVTPPPTACFVAVGLALLAPLATPHGVALLTAPFTSLSFASQYVDELKPVDLGHLFGIGMDGMLVMRRTLLTLVGVAGVWAALASFSRERFRPAPILLFAGGFFLLARIDRFNSEFMLLALPLLAGLRPSLQLVPRLPLGARVALGLALAALPFVHLKATVDWRCAFPFCPDRLPVGSIEFLRQVNATGAILNHPNDGGYLEWAVYPRQKIFVDLQTPFLFPDLAIFAADQAFQEPTVLAGLIAEYHPAFLLVPKALAGALSAWIGRFPDYAPVFVDDSSILLASASAQPELVAKYKLTAIDPFMLRVPPGGDRAQSLAAAAAELARIAAIDPSGSRTRVFEGALALERGDSAAALRIADEVIARLPARPEAYRLRADTLLASGRFSDAAQSYEAALARLDPGTSDEQIFYLEGRLWACYARMGRHEDAYRALQRALGNLYSTAVDYQELASLASAALDAGYKDEARTLIEFALAKTPASESELRHTLESRLKDLSAPR
jgi:tetratricopeptide (TPR) repeat protein